MYLHFPQKSPVQEGILLFEWWTVCFINVVDVTSYIVNLSCSPIKFLLLWISNRNVFSKYAKIFHYMINRSQYTHSNCSPNPGSMNYTILIKSFLLYNSRHACSFPCYSCCFKTRLTTVTTLPWIKEFHILGLKLLLIGLLDI